MKHTELQNLISAYSLGALDDADREALESHLRQGCRQCESLLQQAQEVVEALAFLPEPVSPPAGAKAALLQRIGVAAPGGQGAQAPSALSQAALNAAERLVRRWKRLSFALAFAAAAFLLLFIWNTRNLLRHIGELENEKQMSGQLVRSLQSRLDEKEKLLHIIQSPRVKLVHLKGLPPSPGARGRILIELAERQAILFAFDLPPNAAGKDYQLWMLRGQQPVDAGVFSLSVDGNTSYLFRTFPDIENLTAFAVTLEPKGGRPQPTGQMYLLGAVGGP